MDLTSSFSSSFSLAIKVLQDKGWDVLRLSHGAGQESAQPGV